MGDLARYRVQRSQNGLRHGEVVEVDPSVEYWRGLVTRGVLKPAPVDEQPVFTPGSRASVE